MPPDARGILEQVLLIVLELVLLIVRVADFWPAETASFGAGDTDVNGPPVAGPPGGRSGRPTGARHSRGSPAPIRCTRTQPAPAQNPSSQRQAIHPNRSSANQR